MSEFLHSTIKSHPEQKFEFNEKEWKSPQDMGNDYGYPDDAPGIYMIIFSMAKFIGEICHCKHMVLYVGSAKNLKNRYKNHNLFYKIQWEYHKNKADGQIQFVFRHCENYASLEKEFIKDIRPVRNNHHK